MSFKYILNPINNKKVNIHSSEGKTVLRNYVKMIKQSGGGTKNLPIYNLGKLSGYPCAGAGQNNVSTNTGIGNDLKIEPADSFYSQTGGAPVISDSCDDDQELFCTCRAAADDNDGGDDDDGLLPNDAAAAAADDDDAGLLPNNAAAAAAADDDDDDDDDENPEFQPPYQYAWNNPPIDLGHNERDVGVADDGDGEFQLPPLAHEMEQQMNQQDEDVVEDWDEDDSDSEDDYSGEGGGWLSEEDEEEDWRQGGGSRNGDQYSNESSTYLDTVSNDSTQTGGSVELENLLDSLLSKNS